MIKYPTVIILSEVPGLDRKKQMFDSFVEGFREHYKRHVVRSPFQIQDYNLYFIVIAQAQAQGNPCGEISLGKPQLCRLGVRSVASPFNLDSFRELIVIEPIGFCKPVFVWGW